MTAQTYVPQVLADLEARAGASDQDREQWLAARRAGITATEVRDLANGKTRAQDLIDLKLGRKTDSFSGNAYTDWGNQREPVIAELLRGEGFEPESRVFHHPENSRYLASPDGIQVTWDEALWVSEIKTAAFDLPPGSEALAKKGYYEQVQWVMFVIGAVKCRFVVEERHDVRDMREGDAPFEAGPLHSHWIERDDEKIAELVKIADDFLAELDRQREEGAPEIDEELDTLAVNYLRGLAAEKEGKELKEASYRAIVAMGKSQESPLARVTFTPAKPGEAVIVPETDFEKAKRAKGGKALHEALQAALDALSAAQQAWDAHCERFTTQTEVIGKGSAARATITAGKATKETKK